MVTSTTSLKAAARLDRLYRAYATRLTGLVRLDPRVCGAVVDDACQTAWVKLALHRECVLDEHALSWLATTALRDARRLTARNARNVSLEQCLEESVGIPPGPEEQEPYEVVSARLRVEELRRLPRRQQRLVWLRALGCNAEEMAALSGSTGRTVHRQLHRADRRLRAIAAEQQT